MHKKVQLPFALLIVFSLVLGACATPTTATSVPATQPPVVQPTTPPEPTVAPTSEPTAIPAPDVEALFTELIAGLTPEKSYGTISAAKLNEALAAQPLFLLDVRETAEIEKDGFIEGATHIAIRDLLNNLDKLPSADEAIVVYCASGHRGGMALAALRLLGYTDVRNLGGGLGAWKKANLPVITGAVPAEAQALSQPVIADEGLYILLNTYFGEMPDSFYSIKADKATEVLAASQPPMLIDVRTTAEWDKDGYIEGALNIPFNEFFARLAELPAPDQPLLIYCGSGHRGAIVLTALRLMGYTEVTNLGGGLGGWKTAKLPVAGWVDWAATWAEFMTPLPDHSFYSIKADALNTLLAEKTPFLLDVREMSEIEKDGFIPGAVNIPVRDLLKNLDKLPGLNDTLVVYCASGHRGGMALASLRLLGYTDVVNLAGGVGAWKKASFPVETDATKLVTLTAGTAPVVDAIRLRDLDAFIAGLPEGFYSVKAVDLNLELGGTPAPILVDVRTADEIAQGYITGSLQIPIEQLLGNLTQIPDKSASIVVLCQSGHRGAISLMALRMLGYSNVRNLGGGINAWKTAELPLAN